MESDDEQPGGGSMTGKVSQQEWDRYRDGDLSPEERIEISRRMQEFGLADDAYSGTALAEHALLVTAATASAIDFEHEELLLYVLGDADPHVVEEIEQEARGNPALAARIEAIRDSVEEIRRFESEQASPKLAVETNPEPVAPVAEQRKPTFLQLLTGGGGGWIAAAACGMFLLLVVPRLSTAEQGLARQANEVRRLEQELGAARARAKSLEGAASGGQNVVIDNSLLIPGGTYDVPQVPPWVVPGSSQYVFEGGRWLFQVEPNEMTSGILSFRLDIVFDADALKKLMELGEPAQSPTLGDIQPNLTLVRPDSSLRYTWTSRPGATYAFELKDSLGKSLDQKSGILGAVYQSKVYLVDPGVYTWIIRDEQSGAVSEGRFQVEPIAESEGMYEQLLASPDPVGKAVTLASFGYTWEALRIMDALITRTTTDPEPLRRIRNNIKNMR